MIYLDNAATSFPKPENVYLEIDRCMRSYCANPGRGSHSMAIESGKAVAEARDTLCGFFNIENPMQLCFMKNATEALNTAIKGWLRPGDHVVTTCMEHNAVMRPLRTLERDIGIEISVMSGNEFGEVEPDAVKKYIKHNTRLILSTLSSNVNGVIMPFAEMGRLAREAGIPFLLDASQGAGYIKIDVGVHCIDMLAFPGHKGLLGPQGTGGLYVREGVELRSLMEGGTGSNSEYQYQPGVMPDLLESGTLNTPGIAGLCAGVGYIAANGLEAIAERRNALTKRLVDGLAATEGVKLYSVADSARNSGIAAFNMEEMDSTEVAYILDKEYGIATRAGLHCAPSAHRIMGTEKTGAVRLSIGCFNTSEEIDSTLEAVDSISKKYFKCKTLFAIPRIIN